MPPLEGMHQRVAMDPVAQARYFMLMTELYYRYVIGVERMIIGRKTLARQAASAEDEVAASLQPCVAPGTTDVQAPFEAQGRGFAHGHGKGHSVIGPTMAWLRAAAAQGLRAAALELRTALLSTAVTVQYEAANEPARQLGLPDVATEPFTARQQRQSRMHGGEEEDGTLREEVALGPPVEQPHLAHERALAAAQNRMPAVGAAAYRGVPLTGAFQSTFPSYRQRASFFLLSATPQPALPTQQLDTEPSRSSAECFTLAEDGTIEGVLKPDGTPASAEEIHADADAWAAAFSHDFFWNICSNHEHDCTETCVKYVKKKLEAKESLRSNKTPSCRFWFFRIKELRVGSRVKRVRRRGKPLVPTPFIDFSDERNQRCRCQVRRDQPFRSASNDVCQVTNRCNVDFQFLLCAPDDAAEATETLQPGGDAEPVPAASEPAPRRRLTKKTAPKKTSGAIKAVVLRRCNNGGKKWLYGCGSLQPEDAAVVESFQAAFQKAFSMDFYITKYQGKMMESMTPLFQAMLGGMHRLEQQEKEEQEEETRRALAEADADDEEHSRAKRRRTGEDLARRARRVCIRLASMANRCFWLSTTEVALHILTGGDCLQSHYNVRLFTRQLQWACQQCKRLLNGEGAVEEEQSEHVSLGAVRIRIPVADAEEEGQTAGGPSGAPQPAGDDVADDEQAGGAQNEDMDVVTTSTNTADDYAHRGPGLQTMPFYVYRMHVRRVPKPSRAKASGPRFFAFEEHYVMAQRYVQEVRVTRMHVPTIDGFQCPTWAQDPEQNSLFKALLFTPWACKGPLACGSVSQYNHLLRNCGCPAARPHSFERAWRLRCAEIHVLAARADSRRRLARKRLVLADTTLFSELKEPRANLEEGDLVYSSLVHFAKSRLGRRMPVEATRRILAFSNHHCRWHEEQCTLAEFCAYVARDVLAHVDLAAEARVKPRPAAAAHLEAEEDSASDAEGAAGRAALEIVDVGGGGGSDVEEDTEDAELTEISMYPLRDHARATELALQKDRLERLGRKSRLSYADKQLKNLDRAYGGMLQASFAQPASSGSREQLGTRLDNDFVDMLDLQRQNIALQKKQASPDGVTVPDAEDDWLPRGAPQPDAEDAQPELVPQPLAMQGPAAVAWNLVSSAQCTEEQIDAVALFALSLQKRFDGRPDKTTHMLPVATATGNHRAVWLGGGGVGKTRTLSKVVEPMAITYFGKQGYLGKAQSNHAAQNLGPRGRTIHASNGLLMSDSLQTARLRLMPQTQKKLDRLTGMLGVDVIDELGAVPGPLLHADALRTTYGRALRYGLDPTKYMRPQETWGRVPVKILCGDFYQLPPVPSSASLLAPHSGQSYEHQQGRKLLADFEYVVDFVQMQRFTDPLQLEVLNAMRTAGGKKISEESWQAIVNTQVVTTSGSGQSASSINQAAPQPQWDPRLRAARGWYESAYEWRIVSYAMHAQAKLDAHDAGQLLFYVPAVDRPAARLAKADFDEMRAEPNIGATSKMPGILPLFVGMEVILTESVLPPKYVRGTPGKVVGIEPHALEPPIEGRPSIVSDGVVLLLYMPKAVYVKIDDSEELFLNSAPMASPGAPSHAGPDLRGVLAIPPQARPWKFKPPSGGSSVSVSRTQLTVLPRKQGTLHGVQGKTADPGFIVHWTFPPGLKKESIWLAYYVSLSRPRSFGQLLSHGLPDRAIIEGGPPESINSAFEELFSQKIAATKRACARARAKMGWPARRG